MKDRRLSDKLDIAISVLVMIVGASGTVIAIMGANLAIGWIVMR